MVVPPILLGDEATIRSIFNSLSLFDRPFIHAYERYNSGLTDLHKKFYIRVTKKSRYVPLFIQIG
jgi:hypothetical protein